MITGLAHIHKFFKDAFAERLEAFQPSTINGNLALVSSTRYFHTRHHHCLAIPQAFGPGIDPNGILERIGGNAYIYTEENVVQYLGKKSDDKKPFKYVIIHIY